MLFCGFQPGLVYGSIVGLVYLIGYRVEYERLDK